MQPARTIWNVLCLLFCLCLLAKVTCLVQTAFSFVGGSLCNRVAVVAHRSRTLRSGREVDCVGFRAIVVCGCCAVCDADRFIQSLLDRRMGPN